MRTIKALKAYFKTHGMQQEREDREYSYKFNIGGKLKKDSSRYSWNPTYFDGGTWIGANLSNATYCCGVREMGSFNGGKENIKHWTAILEYVLQKEKLPYLRTETITKENQHKALEKALVKTGFRLVTTIPSRHNEQDGLSPQEQYNVKVWEYLKPNES